LTVGGFVDLSVVGVFVDLTVGGFVEFRTRGRLLLFGCEFVAEVISFADEL
jgi:hypothetical protein